MTFTDKYTNTSDRINTRHIVLVQSLTSVTLNLLIRVICTPPPSPKAISITSARGRVGLASVETRHSVTSFACSYQQALLLTFTSSDTHDLVVR